MCVCLNMCVFVPRVFVGAFTLHEETFGQGIILCVLLFTGTHFLGFCSLGEMGPHRAVTCIAELQENSNTKQMSTQTKWSLETQQNTDQRGDEKKRK